MPDSLIEQLTYFEYTTLVALYLSSGMDYIVLEAGLGGEFDATNVVENNLSVITTIDLDHQSFLGDTIQEIASTKMRSCNNSFILAFQINEEVFSVAKEILKDKRQIHLNEYNLLNEAKQLPLYLQNNLQVALSVLEYLGLKIKDYKLPKLFGRYEKLKENIIIDVGHNPLAAKVIAKQLEKENYKIILIYNTYEDKDYLNVLKILKPYIKEVQIIDCDDKRIINKDILSLNLKKLGLNIKKFDIMNITECDYYLVFGSFMVIESFLKEYNQL